MYVGLTGGIGSGKTAVTDLLASWGALIVDADVVAREVVAPGTVGLERVAEAFGPAMIGPGGTLDREKLAAVVFADPEARGRLNAIVHPLVRARSRELAASAQPGRVVVNAVPLLVEVGLAGSFDLVVVVDVPSEVQLDRLVRLRGMTLADASARIAAQVSRKERLAHADVVLDNSEGPDMLEAQTRALWEDLSARA